MQEEQALTQSPQWSGAELVRSGGPLVDTIRQTRAHVMEGKVGVGMVGHVGHSGISRGTSGKRG